MSDASAASRRERARLLGEIPRRLPLIAATVLVLLVAFSGSRWYQLHSQPRIEIQADAAKYLTAAYNLHVHGAHSLEAPSSTRRPQTRTDLAAGYPFFLSLFFSTPPDSRTLLPRVEFAQALLFSATAALVVLVGSLALPVWAALVAGLLTAANPHLIALSAAMLTETLFVFLLMLGLLLFTPGWQSSRLVPLFLGIFVFGLAAEVRTIGVVLPVLLSLLCLFRPRTAPTRSIARRSVMILVCALAVALVLGLHQLFLSRYGTNDAGERAKAEYQRIGGPLATLLDSARPPKYVVEGIGHSLSEHANAQWRERSEAAFAEAPGAYLRWNLWERWRVMWAFESAYTGTAEPYPMRVSALEGTLKPARDVMRYLHWPLALCALVGAAAALLARAGRPGAVPARADTLTPTALVFLGMFLALAAIDWLPRYTVPLRPVSYLLATGALLSLAALFGRRGAGSAAGAGAA